MHRSPWDLIRSLVMGKRSGKGGYYAVRIGRSTGVFDTWEECRQAVDGVSGARFKKFSSNEEALAFVGGSDHGGSSSSSSSSSFSNTRQATPYHSYSRPSTSYNSYNHVRKASDTFKHTIPRRTQYLKTLPVSVNLSTVSESPSAEHQRPVVYSDGCCTNNGQSGAQAGIGVYWGPDHKGNVSERLSGNQTNQRAEIMAAVRALQAAKDLGHRSVEVRTDSQYTINGVTSWIKKWKSNGWKTYTNSDVKNADDFKLLDKMCEGMDVKWTHVPGHSGVHGNEMADSLAKTGSHLPHKKT